MSSRGKRLIEDFDPNKSDSADSDYDVSAARSRGSRAAKPQRNKPSRKRQRTSRYGDSGSEDISESDLEDRVSLERDRESEEPELDLKTGRPIRKATKNRKKYEESDSAEDSPSAADEPPPNKRKRDHQSLIVRLNVKSSKPPQRRSIRDRSGSVGVKRPPTTEQHPATTRRSSRIARDQSEPIVSLTNSGHHVQIDRTGSKPPEGIPERAIKGGKGLKKPPSAIFEESENSFPQAKKELDKIDDEDAPAMDREIAASGEDVEEDEEEDVGETRQGDTQEITMELGDTAVVPESGEDATFKDDDDEGPVRRPPRNRHRKGSEQPPEVTDATGEGYPGRALRRTSRRVSNSRHPQNLQAAKRRDLGESSDFEPGLEDGAEENISDSEASAASPRKTGHQQEASDSSNTRRSKRLKGNGRRVLNSDEHDSEVADELAEELEDLQSGQRRRSARSAILYDARPQTRKRKPVDYRILRPDFGIPMEDDGPPSAATPSKRGKGAGGGVWQRSLHSVYGPFGGAGGPAPLFGGPGELGAAGGVESDSSDDETMQRPRPVGLGGTVGITPTSAAPQGFGLFPPAQSLGADPLQVSSAGVANLGKIKEKSALADADPLGVNQNIDFDSVGGLQDHIDRLKEMVALPLLYPEVFQRFHVTPPRGVLFHGPPGTGKTLMARALASSVSSHGKKVTFYMRKGADALSKWVGEAERQLRLLFEEARKMQPSIIFFDEIDGLAPVRSSKQDQIHSSIVSTLLALMDGMDGRGQVIVIGATNRPDSIDPALRRPGRFDREFYFPLPNTDARRKILDIHTKDWEPPVPVALKNELADLTKGYGGADLRALCTEAALNAVQRRYPQIYKSNEKLQIKPESIKIAPKDFMTSIKKIVPSSERSATSNAVPLPKNIEPLLRQPLLDIKRIIAEILPQKQQLSALDEAEYEDVGDDQGMKTERMQQEFERSRIFRPRLLIRGVPGMGQQYLAGAILHHFEGLYVQSFDLPTLLMDSSRTPEAAVVQLFTEVRRHRPSVIYLPNVDVWFRTVGETVVSTFYGLLRSLAPTEPILVLAVLEADAEHDHELPPQMWKIFGHSKKLQFYLTKPARSSRREFFTPMVEYINTSPADFPDPADRKKRIVEQLPAVSMPPPKAAEPPSKETLKAQRKRDRQTLNSLKLRIGLIMDQIKLKYKKFRTGVIDESQIRYLYDEDDPTILSTDVPPEQRTTAHFRPYEIGRDNHGEPGLREVASDKFYYNLEIVTIEKRLSNGYYKRPQDFLADIKKLTKDAKTIGDADRLLKANELQANVEVDVGNLELETPTLVAEWESVYQRERLREQEKMNEMKNIASAKGQAPEGILSDVPIRDPGSSTEQSSGAIVLGQRLTNGILDHSITPTRPSQSSALTNGFSGGLSDLDDLRGPGHGSNDTSIPSRGLDDTHMTNSDVPSTERETQNSSFGPSAQTRPLHSYTGAPASLQQRQSYPGSLSQRSAITPMAEGSNPNMYSNDASTTSSDKRMTGSSGPFNTQSTIARGNEGPDLSMLPNAPSASSQLPDTQGDPLSQYSTQRSASGSSQSQPASQPLNPPVPPFTRPHASPIHTLLNNSPPMALATVAPVAAHPPYIADLQNMSTFLDDLVDMTTACSVEQLEQLYSVSMTEIWQTRGQWNRITVLEDVREVLNEAVQDMMEFQSFGLASTDPHDEPQRLGMGA